MKKASQKISRILKEKTPREMTKAELLFALRGLKKQVEANFRRNQEEEEKLKILVHELEVHKLELEIQNQELQQTQALLEDSRDRFADLYYFAPVGYISLDKNGIIKESNLTGASLLGVDTAHLVGHPFLHYLLPKDYQMFLTHIRTCRMLREKGTIEVNLKGTRGNPLPVQLVSIPSENFSDRDFRIRMVLTDLSDLKAAEEGRLALAREQAARSAAETKGKKTTFLSEASKAPLTGDLLSYEKSLKKMVRLTVPSLADGCMVLIYNPDEKKIAPRAIVQDNPPLTKMARDYLDLMNPLYWKDESAPFRVMTTGHPLLISQFSPSNYSQISGRTEVAKYLHDQGLKSFMGLPLRAFNNTLGALFFFSTRKNYTSEDLDFAEELANRAALALDMARLYRKAQDAISARDQFLSIASHELKTPLTPLKLRTQMVHRLLGQIKGEPALKEKMQEILSSTDQQINRIIKLVDELLDTTRIQAGKLTLDLHKVDINRLTHEAIKKFSDLESQGQIQIKFCPEGTSVGTWDAFRLEQVLVNLLANAVKYGRGKPIRVEIFSDENYAEVMVQDQGIGISPEDHARIFGQYERASSSKHFGGLGLGLFISKQIVMAHQGTIRVESQLGAGSKFFVRLPRKQNYQSPREKTGLFHEHGN